MKAKIIKIETEDDDQIEVCVRLERDMDGKDFVKISAWIADEDADGCYYENQVSFGEARNNFAMCERYIDDFSSESAREFVESLY